MTGGTRKPFDPLCDRPLARWTTLDLGGPAKFFDVVHDEQDVLDAVSFARDRAIPLAPIGSGSNLVVADQGFPGLVMLMDLRGISTHAEGDRVELTVSAGEPWDALVARSVDEGLAGFECLAGIPGLVGATPIQNVGAYGQEVSETITRVRTIDRVTGEARERSRADCRFRYRSSIFKEAAGADEIVTSVTFSLLRDGPPTVRYPELEKALGNGGRVPTLASVRDTVLRLRRGKSMVIDPSDENRRSAGSFFTNPIVTHAQADEVARRATAAGIDAPMPRFPYEDRIKLAAGWLIERAGFAKGLRRGPVGISSRHALALVHHGGGTTRDLVDLAREIVLGVQAKFGVRLHPEPVFLGFSPGDPLGLD
jgi:UDP-N-acetylmuramate dehydrogenase